MKNVGYRLRLYPLRLHMLRSLITSGVHLTQGQLVQLGFLRGDWYVSVPEWGVPSGWVCIIQLADGLSRERQRKFTLSYSWDCFLLPL